MALSLQLGPIRIDSDRSGFKAFRLRILGLKLILRDGWFHPNGGSSNMSFAETPRQPIRIDPDSKRFV
jgi:hypothetical protein